MKTFQTLVLALVCLAFNAYSSTGSEDKSVSTQLGEAKKAEKAVFLVVVNRDDESADKTYNIAKQASSKKANSTEVIKLNITDSENEDLVKKFRLSGAPVPLIIVIDKNGNAAGGLPLAQASPEALLSIIPSPAYSNVLKSMSEQKTNFVVAYKESMMGVDSALAMCKEAVKKMNNNAVITKLNIDDKAEAKLLGSLKVNTLTTEPIIYVVNKQGQVNATFKTVNTSDQLVTAAKTAKKSGGCCPGGSKKGGC